MAHNFEFCPSDGQKSDLCVAHQFSPTTSIKEIEQGWFSPCSIYGEKIFAETICLVARRTLGNIIMCIHS